MKTWIGVRESIKLSYYSRQEEKDVSNQESLTSI